MSNQTNQEAAMRAVKEIREALHPMATTHDDGDLATIILKHFPQRAESVPNERASEQFFETLKQASAILVSELETWKSIAKSKRAESVNGELLRAAKHYQAQSTHFDDCSECVFSKAALSRAESQTESLEAKKCSACGGDGRETCDNPDHAFIDAVGGEVGRLGCPGCGHNPFHKTKHKCPKCDGTGLAPSMEAELAETLRAFVFQDTRPGDSIEAKELLAKYDA